jgi:hypothetical protein
VAVTNDEHPIDALTADGLHSGFSEEVHFRHCGADFLISIFTEAKAASNASGICQSNGSAAHSVATEGDAVRR